MYKYKKIKEMGNGSYGIVFKALNTETQEYVAIKQMKRPFYNWNECINLREAKVCFNIQPTCHFCFFFVQSLKRLSHINIMKLQELIREDSTLYMVFEFLDGGNLYEKTKDRSQVFNEPRIKNIMFDLVFIYLYYLFNNLI